MSAHPSGPPVGLLWEGVCEVCACFPNSPVCVYCSLYKWAYLQSQMRTRSFLWKHTPSNTGVWADTFSVSFPVHSFLPSSFLPVSFMERMTEEYRGRDWQRKSYDKLSVKKGLNSIIFFSSWLCMLGSTLTSLNKKLYKQFQYLNMYEQWKIQILSHCWTVTKKVLSFVYCRKDGILYEQQPWVFSRLSEAVQKSTADFHVQCLVVECWKG